MKGLMGGAMIGGLAAGSIGFIPGVILMGIIFILAYAAGIYDEVLKEKKENSWRTKYPTYKY